MNAREESLVGHAKYLYSFSYIHMKIEQTTTQGVHQDLTIAQIAVSREVLLWAKWINDIQICTVVSYNKESVKYSAIFKGSRLCYNECKVVVV